MLLTLLLGQISVRAAVPEGLGVNAHFVDPSPEELARVRGAGFRWVRTDLLWSRVETRRGVYDFRRSDRLLAHLAKAGLRLIWILDYDNPLYGAGPPTRGALRSGYLAFVKAAFARYGGRGIAWEVWNEPNSAKFWRAKPDPYAYVATVKAVRRLGPKEFLVGPAASGFDFGYLNRALASGLPVDAVSVHPYRFGEPESVTADYRRLAALVRWKTKGPIWCTEWGYGVGKEVPDEAAQARAVLRVYLTNLAAGVPVTILYNWTDSPGDPDASLRGYGITVDGKTPKIAYTALAKLTRQLEGFRFVRRLPSAAGIYLLRFEKGKEAVAVGWSVSGQRTATLRLSSIDLDELPKIFPLGV